MYWPASSIFIITIKAEPAFDLNQTPAFFLKVRLQNFLVTRGLKFFFACLERPLRKDGHIDKYWGIPGGHLDFGPEDSAGKGRRPGQAHHPWQRCRQFTEELQSNGAFKFYEDTEDVLRADKFERPLGAIVF